MAKQLKFDYVVNFFKSKGCELLETNYINSKTKMKYRCKCGNISFITYGHLSRGGFCKLCANNSQKTRHRNITKHTYETVNNLFISKNCKLLEAEYKNNRTRMKYICKCGIESVITLNKFLDGSFCKQCSNEAKKHSTTYTKSFFRAQKCELLESNFVNCRTLMKYRCKCNNIGLITFDNFKKGVRCRMCGYERSSKSSATYKDYKTPSGNIIRIQGYENIALDEILLNYDESDIITDRRSIPVIKYNKNGNDINYYPDIFIKSENKIIEVKSIWTYNLHLITNILKALASRKTEYDFEFWIYDKNSLKIII